MTGLRTASVGSTTTPDLVGPVLWWRSPQPVRFVSSAVLGGGVGAGTWFLNASVPADYARTDPAAHLRDVAASFGLDGPGIGMMTAADVRRHRYGVDGGAEVLATVGLGWPTWAADVDDRGAPSVGTVNLCVLVPERLTDAALVNLVATVTEAKVQALVDLGVDGTGTASDAVAVACPAHGDAADPFGGPRSAWGARVARATYAAVRLGALDDEAAARAAGYRRPRRVPGRTSPLATMPVSAPDAPPSGR